MHARRFTVPGYDVVDLLGSGATGDVWLARETASREFVALKRLATPRAGDDAGRDRMVREATVLSEIHHPHVVRLRAVLTEPELVLVLDHAAGGSLADLIGDRGALTPGEVVTTAAPLAQALASVHERGILHGDLSPSNVLYTADGRPLLADLGVARLIGESVDDIDGTASYGDPAVLRGEPPSAGSDVYALAAVCVAALTGAPPQLGLCRSSLGAVLTAAPPGLTAVLESALDPAPAKRPRAADLAVALFDACPPSPVRFVAGPRRARDSGTAMGVAPLPLDGLPVPLTHRIRDVRSDAAPVSAAAAAPRAGLWTSLPSALTADLGVLEDRGSRWVGRRRRRGSRRASTDRDSLIRRVGFATVVLGCVLAGLVLLSDVWAGGSEAAGTPAATRPAPASRPAPSQTAAPTQTPEPAHARAPTQTPAPAQAPATTAVRPASPPDWRATLEHLDARRAEAFAAGDVSRLALVYAAEAPALARDRAVLAQLVAQGWRAKDLRLELVSARVVTARPGRVVLRVVDRMPPYSITDAQGVERERRQGRGEQAWDVTLVAGANDDWSIFDVSTAE